MDGTEVVMLRMLVLVLLLREWVWHVTGDMCVLSVLCKILLICDYGGVCNLIQ